MRFDICTIFPAMFSSYMNESIIGRAVKENHIQFNVWDLRSYARDKHKTTDHAPYSGGAGMLMKVEPMYEAVVDVLQGRVQTTQKGIVHAPDSQVILLSASGKKFTQKKARELLQYKQLVFLCGRYEGVDHRVSKYIADQELSIGNYVLTGGELPAMVAVDAITRLIPGVLKNPESLNHESFNPNRAQKKEYPQYTRPAVFSPTPGVAWKVPPILYSGNHKKIENWKQGR